MGISGLLPFLQDSSRKCHISEFRGCTIAIDSYCWLHRGAFGCADKLVRGENTTGYVHYCLKYIQLLLSYSIKPILVFDGQHLPAKMETEKKRRERRKLARARGTELLRLGKPEEARQYFRECIDINHEMALKLIQECRKKNIDCIVAPYEADAQLAFLNIQRIADVVITEDSDLVLFGCDKILFKLGLDGTGTLVEASKINLSMKMRPEEYTIDKFRYMCIMSGCDYLESLPGIGLKKAQKAVMMTHDPNIYNLLPRLPRYLNIRKLVVPPEYIEGFKVADATLKHQVVYDPIKRQLTRLTACVDLSEEYLKNAGQIYDSERALQLALGNIDPISKKVLDNWDPDGSSSSVAPSSIWSHAYKSSTKLKPKPMTPVIAKPKRRILANELALQIQQENILCDEKLEAVLQAYRNTKIVSQDVQIESEEASEASENKTIDVKNINPFIKTKKICKFDLSTIDVERCTKNSFFSSKTTDIKEETLEDVSNKRNLKSLDSSTESDTPVIAKAKRWIPANEELSCTEQEYIWFHEMLEAVVQTHRNKQRVSQGVQIESEDAPKICEEASEVSENKTIDVKNINPFIKTKKISKFDLTTIDMEKCVKSSFFSSKTTDNKEGTLEDASNKRKFKSLDSSTESDTQMSPILPCTPEDKLNIKRFAHTKCKKNLNTSSNDIIDLSEEVELNKSVCEEVKLNKAVSKEVNRRNESLSKMKQGPNLRALSFPKKNKKKIASNQPTLLTMFDKMNAAAASDDL